MTSGAEYSTNYLTDPATHELEDQRLDRRCLRCKSSHIIPLDKASELANTCYLCRGCGHIFSPALPFVYKGHNRPE